MAFPDIWAETALVEVQKFDGTTPLKWQCMAMTESVDISEPDYPGEGIPTLSGGRVWKQSPMEDGEITLEIYPIELDAADDANNKGLFQQYIGGTYDTDPITSDTSWVAGVSRTRDRFAVSILWTNDATATVASSTTAASTDSLRFVAISCRIISHKTSFTDGIVKTTITFKYPAMNKAGDTMMQRWESGDDTALVALFTNGDYDDEDSWT